MGWGERDVSIVERGYCFLTHFCIKWYCTRVRIERICHTYGQLSWQRGRRCRSSAARLLRLWVQILPEAWMSVCCECCVLSGRGHCDGHIRPEESTGWDASLCDLEIS